MAEPLVVRLRYGRHYDIKNSGSRPSWIRCLKLLTYLAAVTTRRSTSQTRADAVACAPVGFPARVYS
jgi:hypothetical protein